MYYMILFRYRAPGLYRKCCTLPCYLDNRSVGLSSLVFLQRDSYWGLSQPRLRMNWGEGTLALTPSRTWTTTWRRKGLLAANVSSLRPAEGPPPEAEVPKRCPGTIPFSSLSWFGSVYFTLMRTLKNQERRRTQRGRLRFIISAHTSFGGYNIYYIDIYVGYMIIFW